MGEARKAVARPRAKSRAAKAVQQNAAKREAKGTATTPPVNPWTGLMDAGDAFMYGASMEVKDGNGRTFWPKAGVTVHKRPDESESDTAQRAARIVHEALEAIVTDFIEG